MKEDKRMQERKTPEMPERKITGNKRAENKRAKGEIAKEKMINREAKKSPQKEVREGAGRKTKAVKNTKKKPVSKTGNTRTKRKPAGKTALKNIAEKKKLALSVIERLKREYPDAGCSLDYNEAWKLLVSVRLAAQCTDARVNVVVVGLYEKFPDVAALAAAPVEEIEEIVRPCGLGHSKARDISACMKVLLEKYGGRVPDDFDALLDLPGVGRKSANLIMGDVFGKPAIVTDTHCIRLVNRMGLVDGVKEPKKVEMALWKIIPEEEGNDFCHRLVEHGRAVCTARTNPYCDKCCLNDICKRCI